MLRDVQSDITILSLCYIFYAKNHKLYTNDPSNKTNDYQRTCRRTGFIRQHVVGFKFIIKRPESVDLRKWRTDRLQGAQGTVSNKDPLKLPVNSLRAS